jgi:lysozyme family protein
MNDLKTKTIEAILSVEGGYVNDPADSGGETNYGITVAVARKSGYNGLMVNMPRQVAFDIYASQYWDSVRGDQLCELSHAIAEEVVDTGVNMGTKRAGTILQRCLNVLNVGEKLYNDLTVDGSIGPASLSALGMYLGNRDERTLLKALNCLQGAYYIELAERREKDEKFVYGWLRNRVEV